MKRFVLICTLVLTLTVGTAGANDPNSTGVPDKGCDPIENNSIYIGATKMSCSNATAIAKKGIRGNEPRRWSCTGLGTTFGHCHGSRGRIAHWAVND